MLEKHKTGSSEEYQTEFGTKLSVREHINKVTETGAYEEHAISERVNCDWCVEESIFVHVHNIATIQQLPL